MQYTLTLVLQTPGACWCRELTQQQIRAILAALNTAASVHQVDAILADDAGDYEDALRLEAAATLYYETADAVEDMLHADREEG